MKTKLWQIRQPRQRRLGQSRKLRQRRMLQTTLLQLGLIVQSETGVPLAVLVVLITHMCHRYRTAPRITKTEHVIKEDVDSNKRRPLNSSGYEKNKSLGFPSQPSEAPSLFFLSQRRSPGEPRTTIGHGLFRQRPYRLSFKRCPFDRPA